MQDEPKFVVTLGRLEKEGGTMAGKIEPLEVVDVLIGEELLGGFARDRIWYYVPTLMQEAYRRGVAAGMVAGIESGVECACKRCGYNWWSRVVDPAQCAGCHSPFWNQDRVRKPGGGAKRVRK